jgi:V/A-type H+-transporting ATPase subunit D
MHESVKVTRSELLARRARLRLAEQGRQLLQQKRKELMRAFREEAERALEGRGALEVAAAEAREALALAEAIDGPAAVQSAGWAAAGELFVEASTSRIMGLEVPVVRPPEVGRSCDERGASLSGTSPRVDAAAERFEAELELALQLASRELRLSLLAAEIERTTRRANALQHLLIPRLERERDRIALVLQEREREDVFRLRRVKALKRAREQEEQRSG